MVSWCRDMILGMTAQTGDGVEATSLTKMMDDGCAPGTVAHYASIVTR